MKNTLQYRVAERQADLNTKRDQLAAVLAENDSLVARISTQTLSKADVNRMSNERAKQKEILESVSQQRSAVDKRVCEQELSVSSGGIYCSVFYCAVVCCAIQSKCTVAAASYHHCQ